MINRDVDSIEIRRAASRPITQTKWKGTVAAALM